jgi:hypothetical protein
MPNRPPTAPAVEIPCDRPQTVAPSIHVLTLPCWLKIGPHMDPVSNQRDNLQKGWVTLFVKNEIITHNPYSPQKSTYNNSNKTFVFFGETL